MSLETDMSYVYENVYLKAHYDDTIKGYVIKKEDYVPLNLSNRQLNILRKMCKHSKIKLEYHDYRLPSVEDEKLFQEYNELKDQIESNPNSPDVDILKNRRIAIRNKIVTDNLPLVRAIIDRNFDGIQDMPNKEEIYQLGYDVLFTLVDNHTIVIPRQFTLYLSCHLVTERMAQISKLENGIGKKKKKALERLQKAQRILTSTNKKPTTKDLAIKLEVEEERVQELLNLERLLETLSIDEEIKKLNDNTDIQDSPLYDYDFEKKLITSATRDSIKKILYTLPEQQKEVIMLAYGFKDGRCYNDVEIARIMGLSNERIRKIRCNAIENLKVSIRVNYLKELYEPDKPYEVSEAKPKQLKELEEILISQIPKEQLLYYISDLTEKEQTIFLLYHGFEDGVKHTLHSIAKILNSSATWTLTTKDKVHQHIRMKIINEISKNNTNVTYEEYLDYLIKEYIISDKHRKR